MSRDDQYSKLELRESELMELILKVRYTALEEEERLCKQLLEISEGHQYSYGCAFANVYLMDTYVAQGEYDSCDYYLNRANILCKEYGFDELRLFLYNNAGLYYQKLNDDQTALSYFLEGKRLAEKLGDNSMMSMLNNNIGYSFGCREDWETARTYFQMAYQNIESHLVEDNIQRAISYLSNAADACKHLGDVDGAKQALERCDELSEDSIFSQIRSGCGWCFYYAMIGELEQCAAIADQLIEIYFPAIDNPFFVCDMADGLCSNMLDIGDQKRASQLLTMLQALNRDESLSLQYRIQCLEVRYLEQFGCEDKLDKVYEKYYEIARKVKALEDKMRAQSIQSSIQISQAAQEHERMNEQRHELISASQLDELTEVYNRRYLNKLISKITHRDDVKRIGIIMLDVDYFKQYNDFYGHFKGDDALRAVARILQRCVVEDIHVSRYGGDEFLCFCVNKEDSQMESYIKQIITELRYEQIPHDKHLSSHILTVSIGYSNELFCPDMDVEDLMNAADQALYEVKISARGGYARKRLGNVLNKNSKNQRTLFPF